MEESVGDYESSISRKFSSYVPAVENHFYPYGSGYGSMTSPEPIPEPFIDPSTPTNVTVIKGKSAMLACVVHHLEDSAVSKPLIWLGGWAGLALHFFSLNGENTKYIGFRGWGGYQVLLVHRGVAVPFPQPHLGYVSK